MKIDVFIRKNYLQLGFFLAIIASLFSKSLFSVLQVLLVLIFLTITEFKKNLNVLNEFSKKNFFIICIYIITLISVVYRSGVVNGFKFIAPLFFLYGGYLYFLRNDEVSIYKSLKSMWLFLELVFIFGIVCVISNQNPLGKYFPKVETYSVIPDRLSAVFVHPIPASCIALLLLLLTVYIIKNKYFKFIGFLTSITSLILTGSKSSWILTVFCLAMFLFKRLRFSKVIKLRTIRSYSYAFLFLVFFFLIFKKIFRYLLNIVKLRVFSGNLGSQYTFLWRATVQKAVVKKIIESSIFEFLFGHGSYAANSYVSSIYFGYNLMNNLGVVDNMYVSLLFDYGFIFCLSLIYFFAFSIIAFFRKSSKLNEMISLFVLCLFGMFYFFDAQLWYNTYFLLYTFIGMELARKSNLINKSV